MASKSLTKIRFLCILSTSLILSWRNSYFSNKLIIDELSTAMSSRRFGFRDLLDNPEGFVMVGQRSLLVLISPGDLSGLAHRISLATILIWTVVIFGIFSIAYQKTKSRWLTYGIAMIPVISANEVTVRWFLSTPFVISLFIFLALIFETNVSRKSVNVVVMLGSFACAVSNPAVIIPCSIALAFALLKQLNITKTGLMLITGSLAGVIVQFILRINYGTDRQIQTPNLKQTLIAIRWALYSLLPPPLRDAAVTKSASFINDSFLIFVISILGIATIVILRNINDRKISRLCRNLVFCAILSFIVENFLSSELLYHYLFIPTSLFWIGILIGLRHQKSYPFRMISNIIVSTIFFTTTILSIMPTKEKYFSLYDLYYLNRPTIENEIKSLETRCETDVNASWDTLNEKGDLIKCSDL